MGWTTIQLPPAWNALPASSTEPFLQRRPTVSAGHRVQQPLAASPLPRALRRRGFRRRWSAADVVLYSHHQDEASTAGSGSSTSSKEAKLAEQSTGQGQDESEEEPWTLQQLVSVISGFIGSLLSVNAYSKLREEAKKREAITVLDGTSSSYAQVKDSSGSKGARIVQQLGGSLLDAEAESPLFSLGPVPLCTPASNLRRPGRHFTIITTAALPWRTGTAVNPLLRALYLARSGRPVILVLPFLAKAEQGYVLPPGSSFETPAEQEAVVREWCSERAKVDLNKMDLQFRWYPAKYVRPLGSIFPTGDCSRSLPEGDPKDVLILEEPEHLCWYHHGERWPNLFKHVIGIVHTNYSDYIGISKAPDSSGETEWIGGSLPVEVKEAAVFSASTVVCSAYCDVNIKLSDTIMPLPNEVTCNVHGVRDDFLTIGDRHHSPREGAARVYYLGKTLYPKGWRELLDLLRVAGSTFSDLVVDGYGSGPDFDSICREASAMSEAGNATLRMHPGIDHADEAIHGYAVLVNPSTSDVLCTVTAEALAMGKHCVLARHVSNRFFEQFTGRCHFFEIGNSSSFVRALQTALAAGDPSPLPPEQRQALTWEAAVERLFDSAEVRVLSGLFQRPSEAAASRLAYRMHFDMMRDKTLMADIIRSASFGTEDSELTPWNEYFREWRKSQLGLLRRQAKRFRSQLAGQTDHLLVYEVYLKERLSEISEAILPKKQ